MGKGVDDRLGGDVLHWDGYGPSRESIYGCEEIAISIGERECYNVQVQMLEAAIRDFERTDGRGDMSSHLRLLTW